MTTRPSIMISSCLLGNAVRYDGTDKRNDVIVQSLAAEFELLAFCPEVNAGMGVPRPKIQLVDTEQCVRASGVDDTALDVTEALLAAAMRFHEQFPRIGALVVKSKSPSCGYGTTKLMSTDNRVLSYTSGLFTAYLQQQNPALPIADEVELSEQQNMQAFIARVHRYCRHEERHA